MYMTNLILFLIAGKICIQEIEQAERNPLFYFLFAILASALSIDNIENGNYGSFLWCVFIIYPIGL